MGMLLYPHYYYYLSAHVLNAQCDQALSHNVDVYHFKHKVGDLIFTLQKLKLKL